MKRCRVEIRGNNNIVDFSDGLNVLTNCHVYIYGNNNKIVLGYRNNFTNAELWMEDDANEIKFGDYSQLLGKTHIATIEGTKIHFGNECLFSTNVVFRTGDSHAIKDVNTDERINPSQSIKVGNHVWFGNNTTILKGVELKDDTIVGTGSIVTKKVEQSNVIVAGNPAKVIKENISWNIHRKV